MTVQVSLGTEPGGAPALLDLEELLATRLLVQGNSGSGKSHLLRRLLEESAPHVQQLVVDPEGDFVTLAERFGHVVVDGNRSVADLEAIALRLRQQRVSAVLTLDTLDAEMQMRAAAVFLNALFEADRSAWYPMLVVVDEAQLFAPAVGGDVPEDARRASLGAMTNLMCRGRKRGLAGVIATQRLAKLAKNVAAEATNFLMGRTFLDIDMARAADLLGLERRQAEMFRDLQRGRFVALGPALARRPLPVTIGPVLTQPRAGTPTLMPLPEPGQDTGAILAPAPAEARRPAERPEPVAPPLPSLDSLMDAIGAGEPALADPPDAPALSPEDQDLAFHDIAAAVMGDPEAAFRPDAVLHQDFLVRCRVAALPGARLPVASARLYLNAARTGLNPARLEEHDRAAWAGVLDQARSVPDDLQVVFLVLAAAALLHRPCPADEEIARACGHHSPGRARSRIGHLEKRDDLIVRTDFSGRRTAILPRLGFETEPGEATPKAAGPKPGTLRGGAGRRLRDLRLAAE